MQKNLEEIRNAIRHDPDNAALFLKLAEELVKYGRESCYVNNLIPCAGFCCAEWAFKQAWLRAPSDPLAQKEIARIRDYENIRDIAERRFAAINDAGAVSDLGIIGDPSFLTRLEKIVNDDSATWNLRRAAARSLGKLGDPNAFQILQLQLPIWPENVTDALLAGLGNLGHPEARQIFLNSLNHSDFHHRLAAVEGLAIHIRTGAVPKDILVPIISGAPSQAPVGGKVLNMSIQPAGVEIVQKAAEIFADVADETDLPVLEKMIKDQDRFVKRSAVKGLRSIGTTEAYDIIEKQLFEPDYEGYWKPHAIRALSDAPDALKKIANVVEQPEFDTILAACEVFYKHGHNKRIDDIAAVMAEGFSADSCGKLIKAVMSFSMADISTDDFYTSNLQLRFPPGSELTVSELRLDEYFWNITALALARIGHVAAKNVILDLAKKDRIMLEPQIFRAMTKYREKELATKLSSIVKEASTFHLDLAVFTLGRIGGKAVAPVLKKARAGEFQTERPNVGAELAAHYALRRLRVT
ncbi:MAG: HEAT repeat domain-containing protein [Planctomycetota bacterium]|jgi:HEAT repeat protein